jgi:hypothetical protein
MAFTCKRKFQVIVRGPKGRGKVYFCTNDLDAAKKDGAECASDYPGEDCVIADQGGRTVASCYWSTWQKTGYCTGSDVLVGRRRNRRSSGRR